MESLGEDRQILFSISTLYDRNNSVSTSRDRNSEGELFGKINNIRNSILYMSLSTVCWNIKLNDPAGCAKLKSAAWKSFSIGCILMLI